MCRLWNDIKRHFPTTVIVVMLASIAISSTPILKSAYAEGSDGYKPDYTWADRTKAIGGGYLVYSADKASRGLSGFFGGFNLGERLGSVIERGLSGQITSEEMGRQYVSEMWRTFVPIIGEPVYQEYIHNPSAFETTPFSTTQRGMHNISATSQLLSHNSSEAFQVPELSKYQSKRIDFHSLEAKFTGDMENIAQSSIISNPVAYDNYMHSLETSAARTLENMAQSSIISNPVAYDNYVQHYNPPDTQFNNLPSPSTVYRDYTFHNDIGRSFPQPQIYQPPPVIQLETIRISAPAFHPPQIEPMYIPPVPIPVYQPPPPMPPPMPNF